MQHTTSYTTAVQSPSDYYTTTATILQPPGLCPELPG